MTTSLTEDKKKAYADIAVALKRISKRYFITMPSAAGRQELWALEDITFDVNQGEMLGIIGRNGAGKTTLLNIIAGTLSATHGEAALRGRVLGLFNLGIGFQDEFTGRENIFLNGAIVGATRKELEEKLHSIINFSELENFIDMPLGSYSQGMRLRLAFSIIANLDFDILAIDETLAVGDILFQDKCYRRLFEFKQQGKTLVITSQSIELIERLCDKVVVLDHGRLIFAGNVSEGTEKYRELIHTERFFVGRGRQLFDTTKKWAGDLSDWGNRLGTQEVTIDSLDFLDAFGLRREQIYSGEALRMRASFTVKTPVNDPHFGIAIFRADGVYCYGPNTKFDGHKISELKQGKGWFELHLKKLLLSPGEYRISAAVWDKNETIAFDYHNGYYNLLIEGDNPQASLLSMPFKANPGRYFGNLINTFRHNCHILNINSLRDNWGKVFDSGQARIKRVRFYDVFGKEKDTFLTNQRLKIEVDYSNSFTDNAKVMVWLGIYRDDAIFCQGLTVPVQSNADSCAIIFPKINLLPGKYKISAGIWDKGKNEFLSVHHGVYPLNMVFDKEDHGTVYIEHTWEWIVPK